MEDENNPGAQQAAAAVSIKYAEFSESTGWFPILEAQFQLAHITVSSTRFFHCLSALPASIVSRLTPATVASQSYDILKNDALALVERSRPELFESLLAQETMMGRPSACLATLQRTASKVGLSDDLVRHKFLHTLPSAVAPVLAAQSTLSLAQLGSLADELVTLTQIKQDSCSNIRSEVSQRPRYDILELDLSNLARDLLSAVVIFVME